MGPTDSFSLNIEESQSRVFSEQQNSQSFSDQRNNFSLNQQSPQHMNYQYNSTYQTWNTAVDKYGGTHENMPMDNINSSSYTSPSIRNPSAVNNNNNFSPGGTIKYCPGGPTSGVAMKNFSSQNAWSESPGHYFPPPEGHPLQKYFNAFHVGEVNYNTTEAHGADILNTASAAGDITGDNILRDSRDGQHYATNIEKDWNTESVLPKTISPEYLKAQTMISPEKGDEEANFLTSLEDRNSSPASQNVNMQSPADAPTDCVVDNSSRSPNNSGE